MKLNKKYKDIMGNIDKCTALAKKNRIYLFNPLKLTKPNIRLANAIPDLIPDENKTCTFGVKNTIKKRGKI